LSRYVVFLFSMIIQVHAFAQSESGLDAPLTSKIDSLVRHAIQIHAFPGAQVLVAQGGEILHHKSYGYHTYDSLRKVEDNHLYDLASVTKVTAAVPALMYLVDQGKIDLDDPISDYIKEWKRPSKRNITFREALAHHARLKPYIVFWQEAQKKNGKYRGRTFKQMPSEKYAIKISDSLYLHTRYSKKMYRSIKKLELNEERKYIYSGLTFLLYPRIVKDLTGQTIDEFLDQIFFEKIGADRLTYLPANKFPLSEIIPTERDSFFRHQLVHGTVHDETAAMLNGVSTNAGLFGNAASLAKLCQLYLNYGRFENQQLIDSAIVVEFTRCQYCEEDNRRGLGFDRPPIEYKAGSSYVAESASESSYGHSGFTGTFIWMDPAHDLLVVFLSNRVYPDRGQRALYSSGFRPALHQMIYDRLPTETPR